VQWWTWVQPWPNPHRAGFVWCHCSCLHAPTHSESVSRPSTAWACDSPGGFISTSRPHASSSTTRDAPTSHDMPDAANRECRQPGCPRYAVAHGFYCTEHLESARPDPRFNPSGARFRRMRHSFLVRHPMCNRCKAQAATVLDHVIPHRNIPSLYWSQSNWQALCIRCHGIKTAAEMGRGRGA